jgi:hypothetical protein
VKLKLVLAVHNPGTIRYLMFMFEANFLLLVSLRFYWETSAGIGYDMNDKEKYFFFFFHSIKTVSESTPS